ncbi:MAG: hypothetical protein AMJ92_04600 [candidate division Zixibacteria bacterium SM23_81]|nr:MAG: hypothetical protein AMJ92_04600 [candidate division Zixibacteria bacterium SM23_81]
MVNDIFKRSHTAFFLAVAVLFGAVLIPTSTLGQAYTQLQVLLPGETEAPGTPTGKLGSPQAQTVQVPFTVKVRACDLSWNTVTSITNIVLIGSSDESATLPGSTPLVNGQVNLTVTLNAAGSFTIWARDETDPTIPEATSAAVTVLALQTFQFSDIHQKHTYAGVSESYTIWAMDPTGNVVTGYSGPVRLRQITSYGDGRVSPEVVTLTGGIWSGSLTMYRADESSINRGNVNLFAFLEANPSINGTSDPFIVHPGPFTRVQIVVPGQNPAPGSVSGVSGSPATQGAGQNFNVDIYATDTYWNPVPSFDNVRITSSDPGASTPVSGALMEGFRQFSISLGTVGSQTLTVTDQTNGSIQGMTSTGIPVIPSAPDHFEIDPISSPLVAGEPEIVTIRATDVGGNTLPDYHGNATLSANTGPGSISPEDIVFSNGAWTGEMIFRGAGGAVSFTCSDFATPPHTGTSINFQVLPGPFAGLQVLLPGQVPQGGTDSGFSGTPSIQNAGSSFSIMVRAVDAFWNRVPGIDDRIALSSSDAFADIVPETTLVNGELILPVTLFKSGSQTISAADLDSASIDPHTSSAVEVLTGPYSRLLILVPGEELAPGTENGRTGTATDQSINYAFTITVYATDAWWNPVTGVSDLVRITSSDPLAELPQDTPLVDGRVDLNVRLSTGGYQQITVSNITQRGMPTSTTEVRAISSGLHLEAEVNPTTVQAGESFTLTVKVTNDAGSIIQEINSFVDVEVQNASTQEPGKGTLLTTRFQLLQGQRSIQETYTFAESIILIVNDNQGSAPAATDVILIEPGPPVAIEVASNPTWVGGNKHAAVNARVMDLYDNGVPEQPVDFELISGLGTLTSIDSITNADGVARADFLSPRIPEISRVRATSNSLVAELDIETALVNPNLPGGTVTNYPNPFHPGEAPTTIAYKLADNATVALRIYTLSGGLVLRKDFSSGRPGGIAGLNEYKWDGRNGAGDYVSSGGYVLVIEAKGSGETLHVMRRKIAVVR